jgi:SsrA-binding protein
MHHMAENVKVIATNRKASFEYFLLEKFEAGLALQGSEIKSIRAGQMSIQESFVDIEDGQQAWLVDAHIAPYEQASRFNHEPRRRRRLLLHKKQIRELWNNVRIKGMTIVPTRVYLKDGRAKIEIALAKGKKAYDKRATIAKRDEARDYDSIHHRRHQQTPGRGKAGDLCPLYSQRTDREIQSARADRSKGPAAIPICRRLQ